MSVKYDLEYGRFGNEEQCITLQYLERKVLEFRQLTPATEERLIGRKLAKHFGKYVQVAVIIRGRQEVTMLVAVLSEYEHVNKTTNRKEQNEFELIDRRKDNARRTYPTVETETTDYARQKKVEEITTEVIMKCGKKVGRQA